MFSKTAYDLCIANHS